MAAVPAFWGVPRASTIPRCRAPSGHVPWKRRGDEQGRLQLEEGGRDHEREAGGLWSDGHSVDEVRPTTEGRFNVVEALQVADGSQQLETAVVSRAWMSWSSWKDSTFALATTRRDRNVDVVDLLVTMNGSADRVSMHSARRELVVTQADRLGLPLHLVELPFPCPNERYEEAMGPAFADARADDVGGVVFGDLYLADGRAYREQALAGTGIRPRFPLWGLPTVTLAREMLAAGIQAVISSVDPHIRLERTQVPRTDRHRDRRGPRNPMARAGIPARDPVIVTRSGQLGGRDSVRNRSDGVTAVRSEIPAPARHQWTQPRPSALLPRPLHRALL
jgi:diphthamide synthase (EF-2-diphthine--ammonia ligase)